MSDPHRQPISVSCPYCEHRRIETAVSVPYVRGYHIGTRTYVSCTPCARRNILEEIQQSLVKGWFSILAFVLNPVFIVYNALRTLFIGSNIEKARTIMNDLNIQDDFTEADVATLGYQLAICMIKADGKINEHELEVASVMGNLILPNFNQDTFLSLVEQTEEPHSPRDIANLMRDLLPYEGKEAMVKYLWEIARADNETPIEELFLIQEIADAFDLDVDVIDE